MTLGRYRLLSAIDYLSMLSRKWQNRTRASRLYPLRATFVQTTLNLPHSKRIDQRSPNLSFAKMASSSSKESGGNLEKKNRLSSEKSPYLQQHATNPVDWYPWCDEALRKAKDEDKCIFLSVGYSTCHWCHVMEKESFLNKEIAEIMNEHFVNIKVDKEERPDIDRVYMTFIQARTGHGGWPMSLFLTPDLKPILGGTYFPPEDTFIQTGFKRILINIAQKWRQSREKIANVGTTNLEFLQSVSKIPYSSKSGEVAQLECSNTCFEQLASEFEPTYGGFGSKYNMQSPKFPQTVNFNFLFHMYARESKERAELAQRCLHMCVHTLKKMAHGGIHDHVGQGFARYATDGEWHVPHFEKMLYDQGLLMKSYADAYVATENDLFAEIVHDIAAYVSNNLRHKEGGFYSAEDADSYPEGDASEKEEGAFYVWTKTEIKSLLNKEVGNHVKLSDIFCQHFNVKDSGNVKLYQDPHGDLTGKNVLIMYNDVDETAKQFNLTADETRAYLKEACSILYRVRSERPPPDTDYKIITAWNGIMISGLAVGGAAVNSKEYIEYAEDAAKFIKRYLFDERKNLLLHCCYRDEKDNITQLSTPIAAFLDDYAFLVKGLLDLYESSLNEEWLEFAERLQDLQDRLFWDETGGGYFATTGNDHNIIPRVKEVYDGAIPSGNSIAAENLLRLADYLNRGELKAKAGRIFQACSQLLMETPATVPQMVSALLLYYDDFTQIYVAGKRAAKDTDDLLRVIYKRLIPGRILLLIDHDDASGVLLRKNEHLANMKPVNDQATAYVCRSRTCSLPVTTPQQLATLLDEQR